MIMDKKNGSKIDAAAGPISEWSGIVGDGIIDNDS